MMGAGVRASTKHMLRAATAVLGTAVCALAACAVLAPPASGTTHWLTRQLTDNDTVERHACIDGDCVAWSGVDSSGGGDLDIYLHLLSTGATTKLGHDGAFADERPIIASGFIAWDQNQTPDELDGDLIVAQIMLHDLATSTDHALTTGDVRMFLEENRDGHVVYYGRPSGEDMDVYYYDTATGDTTQISTDSKQDTDGSSDGRWVVWVRHQTGLASPYLMVYDFLTHQRTPLFPWVLPNDSSPLVRDGMVAFVRREAAQWDVYLLDLSTRALTRITDSAGVDNLIYGFEPDGDGGHNLLYGDFDAPSDTAPLVGDLYVYNTSTLTSRRITPSSLTSAYGFCIKGNLVTWARQLVPGDADSAEVFVCRLDTGEIRQLTRNSYPDGGCRTDGTRVVWCGQTSAAGLSSQEVFLATPFDLDIPFFLDVSPLHRYFDAIQELRVRDLFGGYAVGSGFEFRPDASLLRAQFAKMLCGAFHLEVTEGLSYSPFNDLGADDPDNLYPHEYVAAALMAGITNGTGAATFSPWADVSRAQVVTMIIRAARQLEPGLLDDPPVGYSGSLPSFSDVHGPNMLTAEYNGLLNGLEGFGPGWDPWAKATRGETAQVLWGLLSLLE